MTAYTSIILHMIVVMVVVIVVVMDSDVDVTEKLVVLVVVVAVSTHSAMEEFNVKHAEISTIWEPIAILLARITILLSPSPAC